jgi:tetratricopeptide (TPR) repeat protein
MLRLIAFLLALLLLSKTATGDDADSNLCLSAKDDAASFPVLMACTRFLARTVSPADRARAYCNRAKANLSVTGWGRAFADYTEAIRVQRDFVDAYIGRARLLMQVRDYNGALFDCLNIVRLSPWIERGYWCSARAYGGKGDTRRAISNVRAALDRSSDLQMNRFLKVFPLP